MGYSASTKAFRVKLERKLRTAAAIIFSLLLVAVLAFGKELIPAGGLDRLSLSFNEAVRLDDDTCDQIFFLVIICLFVMLLVVSILYYRSQKQRVILEQQIELSHTTAELNRVAAEKQEMWDQFNRELSFGRQVLNAVPMGLYWKDENGQIKGQNPAFGTLLEQSSDPAAAMDLIVDEKLDQEVLTKGIDLMHVPQMLTLGGRERKILVSRIPLRGLNGRITGMLNCQIPAGTICSGALCDFLNHTCAMEQLSLPAVLLGAELAIKYANPAFMRWLDKASQPVDSIRLTDLITMEQSVFTELLNKAACSGTHILLPVAGKDTQVFIQKPACSEADRLLIFFADPDSWLKVRSQTAAAEQMPGVSEKKAPEILIVDDVEENRTLLEILLKKSNYAAVHCASGEQAVRACGEKRFDLILMDIQMPDMDGFEAVRQIRSGSLNRQTPVIAMTASEKREDELAALEFGFDDYLSKPINSKQMERKIWRSLRKAKQIEDAGAGKDIVSFLNGDPDYQKAIETFVQNLPTRLEEMKTAFEKRDMRDLALKVHALKGVGGFAGFSVYTEKAKNVEEAIKEDQLDVVARQLDEMVNMCLRTRLKSDCP